MFAWTIYEFGDYKDHLKLEERDLPRPQNSEALIKVKAAADGTGPDAALSDVRRWFD